MIQVWASEDLEEMVCIGSIAELEALSGTKVADLHRETVDKLTIPSKRPGQHSFFVKCLILDVFIIE